MKKKYFDQKRKEVLARERSKSLSQSNGKQTAGKGQAVRYVGGGYSMAASREVDEQTV